MKALRRSLLAGVCLAAVGLCPALAQAKSDVGPEKATSFGPELNPFECYGRYESATGNRTMSQMRIELKKKLDQLGDPNEPRSVKAMKYCVIARLKTRLGDADAGEWYEKSIEADPREPGYELFFGMYWAGNRGARAPVLEKAETHLYRALEKLEALEAHGKRRDYHDVVEDWTRKRLIVLYQQDGQHLLPWKGYPQHSGGLMAPDIAISVQASAAKDTRDYFYNNEMRTFTGEVLFAQSDVRAARPLTPRELWDLARAPYRYQLKNRLRLRHNYVGAVDVLHSYDRIEDNQITSFYMPNTNFADVEVTQIGAGYERVIPLYPVLDLRLAGNYQRVMRRGIVEFLPERREEFDMFELRPSVSRFIGSDKLTVDLVYVHMDVTDLPGGVPEQALREKVIRAGEIEYAFYSPLTLYSLGSLQPFRTPTRGLYLYAGAAQDDEVYGLRKVTRHDVYAGVRFEGPDKWDFTAQGTYYRSRTTFVDPNDPVPVERTDTTQSFSSVRPTAIVQYRLLNPDAVPGINPSAAGFAPDMLNLVFPLHWDVGLTGPTHYENVRGGAELWFKFFQNALWGTAFLATVGYDAQYFYNIEKVVHNGRIQLRMGWGDL